MYFLNFNDAYAHDDYDHYGHDHYGYAHDACGYYSRR
jgi:hypothetical protein